MQVRSSQQHCMFRNYELFRGPTYINPLITEIQRHACSLPALNPEDLIFP